MLLNTRTYTAIRQSTPDILVYAGASNTYSLKDLFQQSRVYPKQGSVISANNVAKPLAKRTKTVTIGTDIVADAIITLGGSLPVGTTAADIDALLADMAAYCASDEAKALFKSLVI